jgi:hypothetical protein
MKKQKTIFIILGLVIGLVVGLAAGLALMNPGMTGISVWEAAGTIGRVDQYRNVRVTEADIELRNELLADSTMREAYRNYLAYEYAANIKMGDDLRFAIAAGREHEGFSTYNARTLDRMEEYAMFLDNVRLRLLEAIGTISDLSDRDRVAIRTVLNSAGNALAQTQRRNGVVFDFMADVEGFFETNPKAEFPQLALAHDQLFANLLMHNIMNDNRPVLEHLLAKEVMDEDGEFAQLDAETLRAQVLFDMENLKDIVFKNEAFRDMVIADIAALNNNFRVQDAAHLRDMGLFDASQLNLLVMLNAEAVRNIAALDSEKLKDALLFLDAAMLKGSAGTFDAEQLRAIMTILDAEQLRAIMTILDAEQLRDMGITDASQLRDAMLDNEQLRNALFLDGEQLRWWDAPLLQMNEVLRGSEMMRDGEFLRSLILDSEQLRVFDSEQLRAIN